MEPFDITKLRDLISSASNIAIVAMGNELSGDDAAGVLIGEKLASLGNIKADIYVTYQSPEAYLMKLLRKEYSHIIFIDAIDAGKKPGEIYFVDIEEIIGEELSTHRFPLKLLLEILRSSGKKIIFIGIQVKRRGIGLDLSEEVSRSIEKVINSLSTLLKKY